MLTTAVVFNALELGFIYALVAMALFLSFRVLNVADMTTDGAFVLGCAVSATAAVAGHPILGLPMAMLAGAAAGFITAALQTRFGVPSILAGIITNTGLYTVNLAVMGFSSNVPMLKTTTIFTMLRDVLGEKSPYKLVLCAGVTTVVCALLILFLGTRLGLSIRATGDNPDMVRASSINTAFTITVGLCVSNSMTALSGAVLAQYPTSIWAPAWWSSVWPPSSSAKACSGGAACGARRWRRSSAASFTGSSSPSRCGPMSHRSASSSFPPALWRWPSPRPPSRQITISNAAAPAP